MSLANCLDQMLVIVRNVASNPAMCLCLLTFRDLPLPFEVRKMWRGISPLKQQPADSCHGVLIVVRD